jgi:hypothetical protein
VDYEGEVLIASTTKHVGISPRGSEGEDYREKLSHIPPVTNENYAEIKSQI